MIRERLGPAPRAQPAFTVGDSYALGKGPSMKRALHSLPYSKQLRPRESTLTSFRRLRIGKKEPFLLSGSSKSCRCNKANGV